jgi:hypothetical protein
MHAFPALRTGGADPEQLEELGLTLYERKAWMALMRAVWPTRPRSFSETVERQVQSFDGTLLHVEDVVDGRVLAIPEHAER